MYCAGRKALAVMLTVGCFVPVLASCGVAPVGGGSTAERPLLPGVPETTKVYPCVLRTL